MPENEAAPESDVEFTAEEQRLIDAWKRNDPEAATLYDAWCAAGEAEVEEGGRTDELVVAFEIRRGLLQFEAGFTEEAHETWTDVLSFVAQPSKKQDLIALVQAVIDSH